MPAVCGHRRNESTIDVYHKHRARRPLREIKTVYYSTRTNTRARIYYIRDAFYETFISIEATSNVVAFLKFLLRFFPFYFAPYGTKQLYVLLTGYDFVLVSTIFYADNTRLDRKSRFGFN